MLVVRTFCSFNAKTIKYSGPHFLFHDFDSNNSFFPMFGIFGNSMTSGEGIWITHCWGTEDIAFHVDVVLRGSSRVPVPPAERLRGRLRKTGRYFDLETPIKGLLQRVRVGCDNSQRHHYAEIPY